MKKDEKNKLFDTWLEDFWEELEIQFYGIIGAIFFFILVYLIFQPPWMKSVLDFIFLKSKLPLG